jgi:hypothetical protein
MSCGVDNICQGVSDQNSENSSEAVLEASSHYEENSYSL